MGRIKKLVFSFVIMVLSGIASFAQNYNEEQTAMTHFIIRMYKANPFEGIKVFTDYESSYLLSVLTLDPMKYPNPSVMNRVAGVKAMSQASRYFNGSVINTDLIVRSVEYADGTADSEIIENIRERSNGYVKTLELLTTFKDDSNHQVFIYCKKLELEE